MPGPHIGDGEPPPQDSRTFNRRLTLASYTLLLAVFIGISYSFGVSFASLEEEFAWSRTTTSSIFSLYLILVSVFAILSGWIFKKCGIKLAIAAMGVLGGGSLLLTSHAHSAWQFLLAYSVLLALGTGAICRAAVSAIARYPAKQRQAVMGAIGIGAGAGILIIAPLLSKMISLDDWRDAYTILGIAAWVLTIAAALLIPKEPSIILTPDECNSGTNPVTLPPGQSAPERTLPDFTGTRNRSLLFLACLAYAFSMHIVMGHMVIRAEDLGMTSLKAAGLLTAMAASAIVGRFMAGWVADTLGKGTAGISFVLIQTAMVFWFVDPDGTRSYYFFAIVFGLAGGGMTGLVTDFLGNIMDRRSASSTIRFLAILWGVGAAAGLYVGGLVFDRTDGYEFAFFCAGVTAMLATIGIWGMERKPAKST